jgi:hypothetical protein
MSKKEYILAVLTKVSWLRSKADHIKELLLSDQLTSEYIEYLYTEFVKAVNIAIKYEDGAHKNIVIAQLNTIKDAEIKQHQVDQIDIDALEQLILAM